MGMNTQPPASINQGAGRTAMIVQKLFKGTNSMQRLFFVPLMVTMLANCASDPLRIDNEPRAAAAAAAVTTNLNETFKLQSGQVAALNGGNFLVAFSSVRSDSRCPSNVTCVWAGNADLTVGVASEGGKWSWSVLNTTVEPRSLVANGYRIDLVGLEPNPVAGSSIPASAYIAQFRITQAGSLALPG
jgi:hypothetical protein